jgi:hypothetical protein
LERKKQTSKGTKNERRRKIKDGNNLARKGTTIEREREREREF